MQFLFLDNFRGFSNTLLPIARTNFLVGENSTGKSSILKLISLLSAGQFTFSPDQYLQSIAELGGFDDLVSAYSDDRHQFTFGAGKTAKEGDQTSLTTFWSYTFHGNDGASELGRFLMYRGGIMHSVLLVDGNWHYKKENLLAGVSKVSELMEKLRTLAISEISAEGATQLDKRFGPGTPLAIIATATQAVESEDAPNEEKGALKFEDIWDLSLPYNITEIAPIRSKPQRYYDATKLGASPEGDHTPLMLRRVLSGSERGANFAKQFRRFGKASGLFTTIVAHSFGRKNPRSPFELRVKFSGVDLSINNVGYGVSQVFPLVVQFLLAKARSAFAVQQPEVHLHPRAQSALGDLIFSMAKDSKHTFFLETHSDYLMDRFRLAMSKDSAPPSAQTLFFQRTTKGNRVTRIPISSKGTYSADQPKEFREFFLKEEMSMLDI